MGAETMNKAGRINRINPAYAIPGGEVTIECDGFKIDTREPYGCFFDGQAAQLVGASENRIIAVVPDDFLASAVEVHLESGGERSNSVNFSVGKKIADELHLVANPAIDPKDDSVIVTRSGSRGQQLPATLLRLEDTGFLKELPA